MVHAAVLSQPASPAVAPSLRHVPSLITTSDAAIWDRRHGGGAIRALWPQPSGARVVFVDEREGAYLYNPVNDVVRRRRGPEHRYLRPVVG
jgi:hypothetical protein